VREPVSASPHARGAQVPSVSQAAPLLIPEHWSSVSVASPPVVLAPVVLSAVAPPAPVALDAPPAEVLVSTPATALTPPSPLDEVSLVLPTTALDPAGAPPTPVAVVVLGAVVDETPPEVLGPAFVGLPLSPGVLSGSDEQPALDTIIHRASVPPAKTHAFAFISMTNARRRGFDPANFADALRATEKASLGPLPHAGR